METVDDKGPKHEFLRLLRNDVVRRPGLFQETAKVGAYVLTHNADKLNNHEYYMAGRAFAMSLIFGGNPPIVLSPSIYSYITVGYDKTTPTIDEVPYGPHREILQKVNLHSYQYKPINDFVAHIHWSNNILRVFVFLVLLLFTMQNTKNLL